MKQSKDKFEFNVGFQWDIIKYTLLEPKGYRALLMYNYTYFALLDQQIIVRAIEKYFQKKGRVPGIASILLEEVKYFYRHRDYVNTLKEQDRKKINRRIKTLFKGGIKEGDTIMENIVVFASYVEVKEIVSKFDITNFSDYEKVAIKIQAAVNKQKELEGNKGSFLVSGVKSRSIRRKLSTGVLPTPFYQLNRTTNAGGLTRGSIVVVMDKEKGGKTLSLINVGRGYLKMRKKVLFIDLENGQESVEDRLDQSVAKLSKKEIRSRSKEVDQRLQKIYRKYKRVGAELYVERMSAGSTMHDIEGLMVRLKEDFGFIPQVLIVDYLLLMQPTREKGRDDLNISQVYIDGKNLANSWDLECLWTANHVKGEAYKRRATRYISGDAAKALDIGRNADLIIGVNQNATDEKMNVMRWEIVDQRDGVKGTIVFEANHITQRMEEYTLEERAAYMDKIYNADKEGVDNSTNNDLDE